jgi:hypothetical protein
MECPSQIINHWAIIHRPTSLTCPFGSFTIKKNYEEQVEIIDTENKTFNNNDNTLLIDIEQNGLLTIYNYKKKNNDEANLSIKIIYNCFEIGYWFHPSQYEEIFSSWRSQRLTAFGGSKNCLIKLPSKSLEGKFLKKKGINVFLEKNLTKFVDINVPSLFAYFAVIPLLLIFIFLILYFIIIPVIIIMVLFLNLCDNLLIYIYNKLFPKYLYI